MRNACLCLIALSRCILPYALRRSCLPNLVLKDMCCGRTIERELESSGRFIPPCRVSLSSCLDVSRIKSLWTDAIVGWDIIALLRLCVGVREAAVCVIAHVGVTVQVTWLSSLGGGGAVSRGTRCGCHWCRGGRGCGVIQSAHADTPLSAPAGSGSCISVKRWLEVLYLIPRQ